MVRDSDGRRGGAGQRRRVRGGGDAGILPLVGGVVRNPYRPVEIFSQDQIEAIHTAALQILEEIGIVCLLAEAREIFAAAGAGVRRGEERVTFARDLIMGALSHAPAQFTMVGRLPGYEVTFGGNHMIFSPVGSAPNVQDIVRGRQRGNFADYENFLRLAQYFPILHCVGGYPVEPVDLPVNTRHLDCLRSAITLTAKPVHAYSLGRARNVDAMEMVRIAHNVDWDEFVAQPRLMSIINTNSPLQLDGPMLTGIIEMARRNQVVIVTPFTLAGAMAPITLAGALALQNAEALAGIALSQLVRPGAPVVYGGFTSNVDMRSGAPAFGTPEYCQATLASGQLARFYGLPFRTSNVNTSNCVDAQAAWESSNALWAAIHGGGNMVMHAAGWLEGGLSASFEKFVIDVEMLQMAAAYLRLPEVDADTLALDAIREVGAGGHFFGSPHTLARYEDAFYAPLVADWSNFGRWQETGSQSATERAHTLWRRVVDELYTPPPLDEGIAEEMDAFVARRRAEGGAPPL